jgi:hypothetical protein
MFETVLAILIGAAIMFIGIQIGRYNELESQKQNSRVLCEPAMRRISH